MRRRLTTLACLLGVTASGFAQQPEVPQDPRLQKTVTAQVALAPLSSVLKELSKSAGFTLETTTALSSRKATVLVKDEPIGTVMARLADLFHGEWKADGDLYRFTIPSDWLNKESAFVEAEDKVRQKEAAKTISPLMEGAAIPYAQVLQELKKPDDPQHPNPKRAAYESVSSPEMYLTGRMFRQMGAGAWRAFWAGRPMTTSEVIQIDPATNAPATGSGETNGRQRLRNNQRQNQQRSGTNVAEIGTAVAARVVRAVASYDPVNGRVSLDGSAGAGTGRLIEWPYPTGELAALPFAKEVLAWIGGEAKSPLLSKSITGPAPASKYAGGRYSMADVLLWLHEQSGVPIVADAFRTPVVFPESGGTVAARLNTLRQANGAFLRFDNGFVMVRHGGFWRLQALEAPESTFQRIESAKRPSLDDYADLAARLTELQVLPFRANAMLLKADPEPIRVGLPALRFYNSLGSRERQAARAGTPIPFGRLGAGSRQLFLDAFNDPLGQGAGRGVNLQDPQVVQALGFLMRATSAEHLAVGGAGLRREVGPGTEMLFGTGSNQGVKYLVPAG